MKHIHRAVALAASLAASAAWAQATAPSANTNAGVGFFRPAPDPALTTTYPQPQAQPQQQAVPGQQSGGVPDTTQMAAAELAAQQQVDALRWAEQQMDRAQADAQQAREQSQQQPAGVGAAFTGSTSERDR